jgi:hypothetical protein
VRTTIRIDDHLLRQARRRAAETGRTLSAVIEDLLREALARRGNGPARRRFSFPTFRGGGVRPGVNLDDTGSLLDRMDGLNAAR